MNFIEFLINSASSYKDWENIYQKIVKWEIQLDTLNDDAIEDVLFMQKQDANNQFFKYIKKNYSSWFMKSNLNRPILSHEIFSQNWIQFKDQFRSLNIPFFGIIKILTS